MSIQHTEWILRNGRRVATLDMHEDGHGWSYAADGAGGVFYGNEAKALEWARSRVDAEGFKSAREKRVSTTPSNETRAAKARAVVTGYCGADDDETRPYLKALADRYEASSTALWVAWGAERRVR